MTLGIAWASGFVLRVICGVSLVWLAAAVGGWLLRRSSAALRHRIWAMSTLAVLGLPAAVLVLPERRVGLIDLTTPAAPVVSVIQADARASHVPFRAQRVLLPDPGADMAARPAAHTPALPDTSAQVHGRGDGPINWKMYLALIWLLPASWLLVRQGIAVWSAQLLLRRANPIETGPASACLSKLLNRLAISIRPRLLRSPEVAVPVCMGSIRPCILLPEHAHAWPTEQLEAVLTHELAHIARRDVLWQMLSRLACAIYWLHPLAWVAAWRMRVERELACDDWVLRGGQSSTRYARWLLDVATMLSTRRHSVESIGVAMASRTSFEGRISAILDPHRRRLPVSRSVALTLTLLAITLLLTIGSLSPLAPKSANAQDAQGQTKASPVTNSAGEPRKVVRISGRVEDEQGKPVSDAVVETDGRGIRRYAARTDADGRFTLEVPGDELPWGRLRASTRDSTKQIFHEFSDTTAVKDGQVRDLRMILQPARQFDVTVNDDKGQAVPGAWVVAVAQYMVVGEAMSNAAGKVLLRMPTNVSPEYILVSKPDVGTDYVMFWRKDQPHTDPYRLAPDFAGPLTFVLNGTKTVAVRVVDEQQRPLKGVRVHPWTIDKPKKGEDANISCIEGFHQLTDDRGIAEFRMIPADETTQIVFWTRLEGYCAPNRSVWDPASGKTELENQMLRQIRVKGRVVDAEGRPASGATVRVDGEGYQDDGFSNQHAVTTDDGRFEIDVNPELYYMFVASKGQLVSKASFQIIRRQAPGPIELKLEPAIRVYGQVTGGLDHAPVPGASVSLVQQDYYSYYKLPKDQQFPGGTTGRPSIIPSIAQHVMADDQGRFEFYVAPGDCEYALRVSSGASYQTQRFTLPSSTECMLSHDIGMGFPQNALAKETRTVDAAKGVELNFYSAIAKPEANVLNGRVVLRDNPNMPVPEATLTGEHIGHESMFVRGTSDRQGNFTVQRGKSDLYLYATTADKKLQGILLVKSADDNVTIPIGPTASARGRLLDENGKALADRQIDFGVRITHPGGSFGDRFGGQTRTAADGSFSIDGLVPGFEYTLNVVMELGDDGHPRSWRSVGKAKAERPERIELGDVKLPTPYRPKTAIDYLKDAFAKPEPFDQQLSKAQHIARLCHQNVLVLLGTPDTPACRQFFECQYDRENTDVWSALAEHVVLAANVNNAAPVLRTWAEQMRITWPAQGMTLAVLDKDGRLVTQTTDQPLSANGKLDRQRLIDFARKNAPVHPDAQKVLDDALSQAKREGKLVFVDESGPLCSWCVKLADYLEANQALINKDFVWITLDRRFANGKQILERMRKKGDYSTPWMAILTADGQPLITSDGPNGNIGYPGDKEGQSHWEVMLRAGARRLTDGEIRQLLQKLQMP